MELFVARRLTLILMALAVVSLPWTGRAAVLPAGFTETRVANGIYDCTAMAFAPDGRLFVCEKWGWVAVIKNGAVLPTPFLSVACDSLGERGLLGVAFDPGFATNQYVYVYYTATTPALHNRISRFRANGDVAEAGSETIILELDNLNPTAVNHNGGGIHFGPDGKLYVGVGENTDAFNSQTLTNRLGKLLRINSDGSIPADNPFFNVASNQNRSIWALGLRNPYTFAFQPGTGRLFINDVGNLSWEEIDEGVAGANYGWPDCEGVCGGAQYRNPIFAYGHSAALNPHGCSIIGATFYNPLTNQFPATFTGSYFFGDYCEGWIKRLNPTNGVVSDFAASVPGLIDLKTGPDGRLYYLTYQAGVWAISATNNAPQITVQPTDQSAAVNESVTFAISASGAPPLKYQWQRNGANLAGSTNSSHTLSPIVLTNAGSLFRCIVTNAFGSATSSVARFVLSTNYPPIPSIMQPTATLYSAGDTIQFEGNAFDAEDGYLPPGAFNWKVVFHHAEHTHPFLDSIPGVTNGSFVIPNKASETSVDVYYHMTLTATDSGGRQASTSYDIYPRTRQFTLHTVPPGLQVTVDGIAFTTPVTIVGVVGMIRTIGATTPQTKNGTNYTFVSWSDGGVNRHRFTIPPHETNFTANFQYAYSLVATNAAWKYLANGVDQGVAWRGKSFNDSAWSSGNARLGYGGDGEVTIVNGGPTFNRYITTYFRRAWNVPDTNMLNRLTLRLLRDDGAVVYLNSNEVFRSNLPMGPVSYGTLASSDVTGADESRFYYTDINPALLAPGTNVLAVEVHQFASNTPDLGFAAELIANLPLMPPTVSLTSPTGGQALVTTNVVLTAAASDNDGSIVKVEFFDGGQKLGESVAAPFTLALPYLYPGVHSAVAVATDNTGQTAASAPVSFTVAFPPVMLTATGSVWKFLSSGTDQGVSWRGFGYNDGSWIAGPAPFGYGTGNEGTLVNGGPATNRYITTYFRNSFSVLDPSRFGSVLLRLVRNDGAVVYLNTNEVFRSNMPLGPVLYNTLASSDVTGAERLAYFSTNVSPALLVAGTNIIAVETHLNTKISPDMTFDLELTGLDRTYALNAVRAGNSLVISWPSAAVGYALQSRSSFSVTNWTTVPNAVTVLNGVNRVTLNVSGEQQFYRLAKP